MRAKIEQLTKVIAGLEETVRSLQAENSVLLDIIHKSKSNDPSIVTDVMETEINNSLDDWAAEVAENFSTALMKEDCAKPVVSNNKINEATSSGSKPEEGNTQKKIGAKVQQQAPKKDEGDLWQSTKAVTSKKAATPTTKPPVSNPAKTTPPKKEVKLPT